MCFSMVFPMVFLHRSQLPPRESGGQRLALLGPHAAASMDLIQVDTGRVCPGDTGDDENFWRLGSLGDGGFR